MMAHKEGNYAQIICYAPPTNKVLQTCISMNNKNPLTDMSISKLECNRCIRESFSDNLTKLLSACHFRTTM